MFKAKGKIIYDPRSEEPGAFQPWTCILKVDSESIGSYYRHRAKRELGIQLNRTLWKDHITVVRTSQNGPPNVRAWKKYDGRTVEFTYFPGVCNEGRYYWLRVECPFLSEVRADLGLKPIPPVPFHLTIGNIKNIQQEKVKALKLPAKLFPWERAEYFNRNY